VRTRLRAGIALAAALAVLGGAHPARAADGGGSTASGASPGAASGAASEGASGAPSEGAPAAASDGASGAASVRAAAPPREAPAFRVALPIAETLAFHVLFVEWSQHVGDAHWANVSTNTVTRNLRGPWVLDGDDYWVNQFGHPYQGTWAFTSARSSGLGFWASAPFTFCASALWEVAGETERPSWNDQITTTTAGIVVGEVLHRFAGALRAEGGAWRGVVATLLEPVGTLNEHVLRTSGALRPPVSRWQLALGSASVGPGAPGLSDPLGYVGFSFTYGVPGSPELALRRPFDHFVLELDGITLADPAATLRARGLVAGATFGEGAVRGLYGAYLSYDFATPGRQRISTSAIGFGGSARLELGGGFALEGDAVASAVLIGAGGKIPQVRPGADRDYRFGPGEQALLEVRVLAGTRARAGFSLRQYLLSAADEAPGTELVVHGSATATLRVAGPHGLGVELDRYLRKAGIAGEPVHQVDSAVRVYYVLLGGAGGR
jgi:hypothetical protein